MKKRFLLLGIGLLLISCDSNISSQLSNSIEKSTTSDNSSLSITSSSTTNINSNESTSSNTKGEIELPWI